MHSQPVLESRDALVCFSHLRWNFVFQRPQHLMTRCALTHRVYYVEEPMPSTGSGSRLSITRRDGVTVVVPELAESLNAYQRADAQRALIDQLLEREAILDYVLWYYTPMALEFTSHLAPSAIVYDCMDELSGFQGAPSVLKEREAALISRADLMLTGGQSLFEAKRRSHTNVHAFPSSVDVEHFRAARRPTPDPADQQSIPHPRLGFAGVIDERMDRALLDAVATARPDWHFVMVGPVVKIEPASLPQRPNIHYLGSKLYDDLPAYMSGWDVALLPFAHNEATRFISPTKTPEYMAAGLPAVSTSIRDVVRPYGQQGLVRIADAPEEFVAACEEALVEDRGTRLAQHDAFLLDKSWDDTWNRIHRLMAKVSSPAVDGPALADAAAV